MEFKRLVAYWIDLMFATIASALLGAIIIGLLKTDTSPNVTSFLAWAFIFCKDSFNGRSLGKVLCKYQVIDVRSGKPARPLQCLLRNLFLLLGIIDLAFMLRQAADRRLGDWAAHTKVVKYYQARQGTYWPEAIATIVGTTSVFLLLYFLLRTFSSELGLFGLLYQ